MYIFITATVIPITSQFTRVHQRLVRIFTRSAEIVGRRSNIAVLIYCSSSSKLKKPIENHQVAVISARVGFKWPNVYFLTFYSSSGPPVPPFNYNGFLITLQFIERQPSTDIVATSPSSKLSNGIATINSRKCYRVRGKRSSAGKGLEG